MEEKAGKDLVKGRRIDLRFFDSEYLVFSMETACILCLCCKKMKIPIDIFIVHVTKKK